MWQEDAEPELAKLRREAVRTPRSSVAALSASATREVRAWTLAWQKDWETAARAAVEVLEHLTAPELRPYRALWAYLGSAWSALAAADGGSSAATERSAELLRRAHRDATGTTWLKEVQPLASEAVDSEPIDEQAVERIIELVRGKFSSSAGFESKSATMLADLNQQHAGKYEQGLVALGQFLGAAESFKPAGQGRADAVWIWATLWVTLEAKSEQKSEGMLSIGYLRQTNTQLDSLAGDRTLNGPPAGSISVIVSPRSVVSPDAVPIAGRHVHLTAPKLILDIAHDTVRAWKDLRGVAQGVAGAALHPEAARILWEHRVLPTQVRERLSKDPIRGA